MENITPEAADLLYQSRIITYNEWRGSKNYPSHKETELVNTAEEYLLKAIARLGAEIAQSKGDRLNNTESINSEAILRLAEAYRMLRT